jgi:predicted metal-dependent phosphoesterase TrpH
MIDLHCHSACSDGTDPPEALPGLAAQIGLNALALTDHDTVDGLDSFLGQQPSVSARLVPGIELSCEFLRQDMHVLGLFIDHRDPIFQERVKSLRVRRQRRNAQIFQNLTKLKIKSELDALIKIESKKLNVLTRAHIAKMLVETGHAATKADAFQKYLGEGGLAYAPFDYLSPEEAFKWIREAKGVPVIAHPGRYGRFAGGHFIWDKAMPALQSRGANGIETYYTEHSEGETKYFLELCQTLGMAPSGGSDYHGLNSPGCKLGFGRGGLNVPDQILDKLINTIPN